MGQIRQSFPGGYARFKKLLLNTVAAPILEQQAYQTMMKLESAKLQRKINARHVGKSPALAAPYEPENQVKSDDPYVDFVKGLPDGGEITVERPAKRFHGRSASRLIN